MRNSKKNGGGTKFEQSTLEKHKDSHAGDVEKGGERYSDCSILPQHKDDMPGTGISPHTKSKALMCDGKLEMSKYKLQTRERCTKGVYPYQTKRYKCIRGTVAASKSRDRTLSIESTKLCPHGFFCDARVLPSTHRHTWHCPGPGARARWPSSFKIDFVFFF